MNWDAIGAISEIIGASAVFISLLYLALQIRSSRRSDQIIAATGVASAVDEWLREIVRDEKLYDLYWRGLIDYESLSKSEKGRFSFLILQLLRATEIAWRQLQMGVMEAGYWAGLESSIRFIIGSTGGIHSLAKNRVFLSPDFSDAVQKILDETD